MEAYLEGKMPDERRDPRADPQGHDRGQVLPGVLRLGLQEQGRAAAARRRRRLSCRRRSTFRRSRASIAKTDAEIERHAVRRRAAVDAGLQDHERPVRRLAHLLPHLFGQARPRASSLTTRSRTRRSASAACCRCMPTPARTSTRPLPATSSRLPASRTPPPATRCAIRLKPVILERMEFPEPVIEIAVEPKTKADQEKMGVALNRLAAEDPSFRVKTDEESGQTIIKGMGELHLDIIVDRMRREFKVEANVGAPQVAYRETITRSRRTRLHPQEAVGRFGPVRPRQDHASSRTRTARTSSSNRRSSAATFRRNISRASRRASRACMSSGSLVGFPIIDVKATLIDGAYHDVDSSVLAFEIAGRAGIREAAQKAGVQLLEPIMKVEVVTPEDYVGDVIGDLNSPSRPDPGHRKRAVSPGRQRDGAARQHVRLRQQAALDVARAAPSTRCSSITTSRCRPRSRRKSRRNTRNRQRSCA